MLRMLQVPRRAGRMCSVLEPAVPRTALRGQGGVREVDGKEDEGHEVA